MPTPKILSLLVVIVFSFAQSADLAIGDDERPFGLKTRTQWTSSRVIGTPDPPPPYTVERAFPNLKFKEPVFIAQEPGTDRFLVAELSGKILAFTRETPDHESCQLFLEIPRQIYSFSFHPNYQKNGQIFVFSPTDPKDKSDSKLSRVSRFQADLSQTRSCKTDSEQVIVEWTAGGHNGGEAIVGPDGYLYVCTGDSTSGSDPKGTGQGVDDLLSVMMRLDIDHPTADKAYSIPPDNPFVNFPGARPEIWAFGFRNPWRMSFDERTGALWVGDVGQDLWEMIWVVKRAGNYGWSTQEGSHPFHPHKPAGPGPVLPPIIEHHHTDCRSITGGYVYYGETFPELEGAYFYGDYEYGKIWALKYDGQQVTWKQELADTNLRIASFGVSRDGQILLIDHPSGEIHSLVRAPQQSANSQFPQTLSQSGLFESVADHRVAPGVIPYTVNAPQWLDNSHKVRFAAIPPETQVEFVERSSDAKTWGFSDGSVLFETISLETELGNPKTARRIETRLLVKQQNHWLGYSYLWNDEQTDAFLVGARGTDLRFKARDRNSAEGERQQVWHVPSRSECMVCHSRAAGFVLGLNTPQMNRAFDYDGVSDNQLRSWNHIGLFREPLKKEFAEYDVLPNPYDETADLEARARSYLHVNCSVCHVSDGGGNANMKLRYFEKLADTKIVDEKPIHGTFDLANARLIAPGDPFASVLYYRLSKWGRGRMPHLGSQQHDERTLQLIRNWIQGIPKPDSATGTAANTTDVSAESVEKLLSEWKADSRDEQGRVTSQVLSSTRSAFITANLVADTPNAAWRESIINAALVHADPNIRDLFERFVPPHRRTQRLGESFERNTILELVGDAARGRQLFFGAASQCKSCHRVNNEGGLLGPELTGIAKKNSRQDLLDSLIDPSRKIDPKFATHTLLTIDGKVHSGILVEKTEREVALQILQGSEIRALKFPIAEIEDLQAQMKSLMPDHLLRDWTAQQAADLLEYLNSLR